MTNEIKLVVVAVAAAALFAAGIVAANARLRASSDLPFRTVELGLNVSSAGSRETLRGQQTPQAESSLVPIVRMVRYGSVQEYQRSGTPPARKSDEDK